MSSNAEKNFNGKKTINYNFFYKAHNPRDLTFEHGKEIVDYILRINGAQLSKGIYYGLEIIHQILKRLPSHEIRFMKYYEDRIANASISWATQIEEMHKDFNQHGQTNGVLQHYLDKCYELPETNEELSKVAKMTDDEKKRHYHDRRDKLLRAQGEFINMALVHSYITGKHNFLATIFVELEREAEKTNDNIRIGKLKNLVHDLSQCRPDIWDAIEQEREDHSVAAVKDYFVPVTSTIDDSDLIAAGEDRHMDGYVKFRLENPKLLTTESTIREAIEAAGPGPNQKSENNPSE